MFSQHAVKRGGVLQVDSAQVWRERGEEASVERIGFVVAVDFVIIASIFFFITVRRLVSIGLLLHVHL